MRLAFAFGTPVAYAAGVLLCRLEVAGRLAPAVARGVLRPAVAGGFALRLAPAVARGFAVGFMRQIQKIGAKLRVKSISRSFGGLCLDAQPV